MQLIFILDGDYKSYLEWSKSDDFFNLCNDVGIIIRCSFEDSLDDELMDKYESQFIVDSRVSDIDEVARALREDIRKFIKINKCAEFDLISVRIRE